MAEAARQAALWVFRKQQSGQDGQESEAAAILAQAAKIAADIPF